MPDWKLHTEATANAPACDGVRRWLREFNREANAAFVEKVERAEHAARPLVVIACVGDEVVGGLIAETQFAWLKTSIMAVAPEWRRQGIGAALLAEAERQAADRGCLRAYVDTMEY